MRFRFTKSTLDALDAPGSDRAYYADTETRGLRLAVFASGTKVFYLYVKVEGRPERIKLGAFPDLSVQAARSLAQSRKGEIAHGRNPAQERREKLAEATFGELFEAFMTRHAKPKRRSWAEMQSKFDRYLKPLAHRKATTLAQSDFAKLHSKISRDHPTTANRVLALASSVFGRVRKWGDWLHPNPCAGIELNDEGDGRKRHLKGDELRRFMLALLAEPNETIRDYVLVSLLTGARRGNVLRMRWSELDLGTAEWSVPITKSGEPQTIPLPPEAVAILKQRLASREGPFVFPASRSDSKRGHLHGTQKGWLRILEGARSIGIAEALKAKGVNPPTNIKDLYRAATVTGIDPDDFAIRDLRIHDLRHTLAMWQVKTGASLVVIKDTLGHRDIKTTLTYARGEVDPIRSAMNRATSAMMTEAGQGKSADVCQLRVRRAK